VVVGSTDETVLAPATAVSETAAPVKQHEAPAADRRDPAMPHPRTLLAYIDKGDGDCISGWVYDPQQPDEVIALELTEGDVRLASVLANQYRSDLRWLGFGDGRHGFSIPLAELLMPGARHVLKLRCAASGVEIPGSPIIIECPAPDAAEIGPALCEPAAPDPPASATDNSLADGAEEAGGADPAGDTSSVDQFGNADGTERKIDRPANESRGVPDRASTLQSDINSADWTGIRGWVWDPQEPQKRVALELLDGNTALATVVADDYRADLEQAGIGDGRHGFSISFNETLLPYARHVLHLRPVGAKDELASFPLVLTRDEAGFDQTIRFILGNIMAEATRAEAAEDLAPIINALIVFLDAALSRYFQVAEEEVAKAAGLLNPAELAPQVRTLIDSLQRNYPPIVVDTAREPLVSIVIPAFNKFDLTYNCVKSIAEHGARVPFEIIIVDDCSRDKTMFAAFAFGSGTRFIRNPENLGFIRSCNRGFEAARGQYIVFLNNDTEVRARWLDELYETMQREPNIGVAGAKFLFAKGSLQECGGITWRLGEGSSWGRGQAADDPRFCYMRDVDWVSSAALMIKADLFREVGKFDEHYLPMYYENVDLCFRVRLHGHRVVVQPAAEVVRFDSPGGPGTNMQRFEAINHRKFFERWKDTLASHRFKDELPDLEAERNVRRRALLIDSLVPEPDKDAGSNAAFQHMLSLQRLGYKVTFLPGDNLTKVDPYTAELQRRGIECLYQPYYVSVEDVFAKHAMPFELVYLHRYSNASKYPEMIRQHSPKARILYSVADLHFLRTQRQAEVENDPALREEAERLRRLELGAMSLVDCVLVHSAAEAELLRQIAPDVEVQVVPWTVPLRDIAKMSGQQSEIAFIGNYYHLPNVDAAKWAAHSIMPALRGKVPDIELLLVGSHMPAEVAALAAKDIVPLGYVPSLDSVFARVRLTIAPLRYGAGLKGKVLESLAAGIPCVMTTVAAEGLDLPGELQSLVADEPDAFAHRIASLWRDDDEYRRIVEAGKVYVGTNYSPERIDALIREACGIEL
jgi:GT2 family glycosyltransferase